MAKFARIEVKDDEEKRLIEAGMKEPDVRAFVIVSAVMSGLPSSRARKRVLTHAADMLDEQSQAEELPDREKHKSSYHCLSGMYDE